MKQHYCFLAIFLCLLSLTGYNQVVINEAYGGGNNSGAVYQYDFVELFNNNTTDVDISGWKIEYFSATGGSGGTVIFTTGATIKAKIYFLLRLPVEQRMELRCLHMTLPEVPI